MERDGHRGGESSFCSLVIVVLTVFAGRDSEWTKKRKRSRSRSRSDDASRSVCDGDCVEGVRHGRLRLVVGRRGRCSDSEICRIFLSLRVVIVVISLVRMQRNTDRST